MIIEMDFTHFTPWINGGFPMILNSHGSNVLSLAIHRRTPPWLRTSVCPYGIVPPTCAATCKLIASGIVGSGKSPCLYRYINQWVDLREHLQETIDFPLKYGIFL